MLTALQLIQGVRFVDSFFPSGGFAFSSGLEAAVQHGAVTSEGELSRYLEAQLRFGLGTREAVGVARAHAAAAAGIVAPAVESDWELDSLKIGQSTREASRQMGRRVLRIALADGRSPAVLVEYAAALDSSTTPGHVSIVLGLVLGVMGWSRDQAVAAVLYQAVVGMVSAALKLLPVGQVGGQRVIEQCLPCIDTMSRSVIDNQTMTGWTPLHDLFAMQHGSLEHRLFRS